MKTITLLILCSLAERAAAVLIIDDFSRGGVSLDTVNGEGSSSQIDSVFLNPSSDFTNLTRRLEVSGSTRVVIDATSDFLAFNATGSRGNGQGDTRGNLSVDWTFAEPTSLLGSGNSGFLLDISEFITPNNDRRNLNFFVASSGGGGSFTPSFQGPTQLEFSFSNFANVDFSAVERISINFDRQPSGTEISFDSLQVIPEPSTMGLLGLATLTLLRRRRNQ